MLGDPWFTLAEDDNILYPLTVKLPLPILSLTATAFEGLTVRTPPPKMAEPDLT